MATDLKIKISIDKETGELKVVKGEFEQVSNSVKKADTNTKSFGKSVMGLAKGVASIYAINKALIWSLKQVSLTTCN